MLLWTGHFGAASTSAAWQFDAFHAELGNVDLPVRTCRLTGDKAPRRSPAASGTVRCPNCDQQVLTFGEDVLTVHGARPVELTTRPSDDSAIIACPACRTLIPLETWLFRVF